MAKPGGVYREAAVGQPRYLNPIVASASDLDMDITRLVYSGLFQFNEKLELQKDLASSYEISEDNKTYTIKLREDVKWHDGETLNADDVVFTFRSIKTPDYISPLSKSFQGVEIEKIDDSTVSFTLKQPYAPFLTSLALGIVPEHVWSQIAPKNATLSEQILKPVGTGPFEFSEITTRRKTGDITSLSLTKNEDYYGKKPYLDKIVFDFYSTNEEALQALKTGEVHGVGFLPLENLEEAQKDNNIDVDHLLLPQYFAIFFNTQKNEALSEAGVRAALSLATDRQQIVEQALHTQGKPLHLPIPENVRNFQEEKITPPANIKAAKQNLSESGWELGDDGFRYKDDNKLSITLTTTDWPEYIKTAELIKEQWKKVGVEVKLDHLGAGNIQQIAVQPRNYEALLFGEILPPDPDPYPFWHSTQNRSPGLNLSLFDNEEVDKLLEEARKVSDNEKRAELYRQFQNKILELSPAIILYQPYYLYATTDIYGIEASSAALPAGRFNNIEEWHINRERIWKD